MWKTGTFVLEPMTLRSRSSSRLWYRGLWLGLPTLLSINLVSNSHLKLNVSPPDVESKNAFKHFGEPSSSNFICGQLMMPD